MDNRQHAVIKITFSTKDCGPWPVRLPCIRSKKKYQRRTITIRPKDAHLALHAAREREQARDFATRYALRAGIEGTRSQGVRAFGLRRATYIGQAKTHLQHILTACAMNFVRVAAWLDGVPLAHTRHSPFVQLMTCAT